MPSPRAGAPNLERQVCDTTVCHGDVTKHVSTTHEALEAIQRGMPVPNGTQLLLTDDRDEKISGGATPASLALEWW